MSVTVIEPVRIQSHVQEASAMRAIFVSVIVVAGFSRILQHYSHFPLNAKKPAPRRVGRGFEGLPRGQPSFNRR